MSSSKANAIKEIRLVIGVLLKNGDSKGILPTLEEPKWTERKEPDTLGHCVVPDYPGLSERIGRIVCSARICVAYKPLRTIRNVISKLKDTISTGDKSGVVYHSSCRGCDQFSIGETGRNLKQRLNMFEQSGLEM